MHEIDIKEEHEFLLELAKEFHRICCKYQISYFMLGGTMLGAVRHKGFIPWDDDMDFGVSRKEYGRLVEVLKNELPVNMKVLTMDNASMVSGFVKMEYQRTVILDTYRDVEIGINIDIFPLDNGASNKMSTGLLFCLVNNILRLNASLFLSSKNKSFFKRKVIYILRKLCFLRKKQLICMVEFLLKRCTVENSDWMINYYGRWGKKEIMPSRFWANSVLYQFHGIKLYGIAEYDEYLTRLYGDYRQMPSLAEQKGHSTKILVYDEK